MVTIYILECKQGKFYVGKIRTNVWKRIKAHFEGKGAKWTKKYKPIDIYDIRRNLSNRHETRVTLEMMEKYGIDNVRGGALAAPSLPTKLRHWAEYRLGIREDKPDDMNFFPKEPISPFKKVLLPHGTAPGDTCLAMKKNGTGRCKNKAVVAEQLCGVHKKRARRWRTVTAAEIESGKPVKKTKKRVKKKRTPVVRRTELWPENDEVGAQQRVGYRNGEKIALYGQCRGSIKNGRRCRLPCEDGKVTCYTHRRQRKLSE